MTPLSELVHRAWVVARTQPPVIRALPARERAAAVAIATWGEHLVTTASVLLNIAALADAARDRLVVHQLRAQTAALVDATDLRSSPTEPPALMNGPWLVEPADTSRPLAGGVIGVGAYELDGRAYVVTLTADGGAQSGEATLHWDSDLGATFDDRGASEAGLLGISRDEWAQPLCQGVRTALVLGILLDAERTPLEREDHSPSPRRGATRDQRRAAEAWTTRTCSVRAGALGGPPVDERGTLDTRGLAAVEARVSGHLKRQPHGPGGRERRYVWIESYEARRWVAPATRVRA